MSSLPPLSFFPPLNRPPPSSYWPVRGSRQSNRNVSVTHPSKFLAAEIEALSDEEASLESSHLQIRHWGTKDLKPAGRTTTWDEDEDDAAAGVVDESSPAINNSATNGGAAAASPAETEVAPTHANYLGGPQDGNDSDNRDEEEGVSPVRDLDEDIEEYQDRSFVNNHSYDSDTDEAEESSSSHSNSNDLT